MPQAFNTMMIGKDQIRSDGLLPLTTHIVITKFSNAILIF